MRKDFKYYIFIVILCIPLFFINVKSWTDWGDDFAQYMHQSNNILYGIPQSQTGYIFNEDYPTYAPPSYPAGFPLLLTPVIKFKGNDIYFLNLYITFFLLLFAIMIFAFLKRYYSALISSLIVVLIVYNPWTLAFKADVLSDIPFALIFGVLLVHFNSVKKKSMLSILIFSVLCAFMILIRSIGITFIIAILFQSIIEYSKYHISKNRLLLKSIYEKIIFSGISFLLFILFNKISSPQEDNGIFNYEKIIDLNLLVETIQTNMTYYSGVLRAFFEPWNDNWQFVAIITGSMIFTFIILGMIRKMSTQFNFTDSLFLVYLGIIMVYPYSNAGFRFLLPLIPILSLYLLIGILNTDVGIRLSKNKLAILLTAIVLFSYQKGIREACLPDDNIIEGPQVKENSEMFQYIISNTPPDARFSFKRPRALAFYTGRNSMTHRKEASQVEIAGNLKSKNIDYILINEEDHNQNMIDFLNSNQETINKIWENSKNKIYKIKKAL